MKKIPIVERCRKAASDAREWADSFPPDAYWRRLRLVDFATTLDAAADHILAYQMEVEETGDVVGFDESGAPFNKPRTTNAFVARKLDLSRELHVLRIGNWKGDDVANALEKIERTINTIDHQNQPGWTRPDVGWDGK